MSRLIQNDKCPKCLHQIQHPKGCLICTYLPRSKFKLTRIRGRSQELKRRIS